VTPELQTDLALGIVAMAAALFVVRWWRGRGKKGCGSACNCGRAKRR
jgi:hypothetical protein